MATAARYFDEDLDEDEHQALDRIEADDAVAVEAPDAATVRRALTRAAARIEADLLEAARRLYATLDAAPQPDPAAIAFEEVSLDDLRADPALALTPVIRDALAGVAPGAAEERCGLATTVRLLDAALGPAPAGQPLRARVDWDPWPPDHLAPLDTALRRLLSAAISPYRLRAQAPERLASRATHPALRAFAVRAHASTSRAAFAHVLAAEAPDHLALARALATAPDRFERAEALVAAFDARVAEARASAREQARLRPWGLQRWVLLTLLVAATVLTLCVR